MLKGGGGSADRVRRAVGRQLGLPIYEIALMTQRRALERGRTLKLAIVTPEPAPLAIFGSEASEAVAGLLAARGIELGGRRPRQRGRRRRADSHSGGPAARARCGGRPAADGGAWDRRGCPDDGGFLPIDLHARVKGVEGVYGAGDGTNFPIKQGRLGTQQADAAAAEIAPGRALRSSPEPFHPVLRGKLLTGEESVHLAPDVAGGGGGGAASADYLWWPPQKIGGRYLAAWLAHGDVHGELEAPAAPSTWRSGSEGVAREADGARSVRRARARLTAARTTHPVPR